MSTLSDNSYISVAIHVLLFSVATVKFNDLICVVDIQDIIQNTDIVFQ